MSTNSSDPLIGRLIDGRYQIRSRIARGGMATVYLATDLRLERKVAIKVMHGHLADDADYRLRFIQEARSAARLAHPNVVNVYDQGQDDETAYLVMEYLPGMTLRDLLNEQPVLTTEQAIDIMQSVLSGLSAAHRNGIVHRDLKPENVLLADDGRIKLSDFGLARAVTQQTATGAALLGTIAYLSPELVTRGIADERSDIYALGIMLFEMLTGEQPFKGSQPFQIANQHANSSVPLPSSINPSIPVELDELVLWASAKDPDQRPSDARVMLEQLREIKHSLSSVRTRATKPNPDETLVLSQPNGQQSPDSVSSQAETQVLERKGRHKTGSVAVDTTTALATASAKRKSLGVWLFILVLLLAAGAGATGWYFGSGPGSKVSIPFVAGKDVETATKILEKADLKVSSELEHAFSIDIAKGLIVGTNPKAGSPIQHGSTVKLVVSDGPKLLPLPKLVGESEQNALASIKDSFKAQDSIYQFNADVAEGIVIAATGSDPDGNTADLSTLTEYWEGRPITLVVSLGKIPEVANLSIEDATSTLEQKGLEASTSEGLHDWSDTVEKGKVIGVKLPEDPVVKGTVLQLIVSDGVEQVEIPNVVGMTWQDAKPKLLALGFKLDYNAIADAFPRSTVKKISPDPGEKVDKGTTLKINFNLSF
ncbi:MAG: Stk1 family PASTA domain-containing Ser/Thr kinase [Microbacteriaceae bacterium]|nr:Stk1 family PASTA domain-containing Ser/Thr kinase [Microbacteriaceae bacterium]